MQSSFIHLFYNTFYTHAYNSLTEKSKRNIKGEINNSRVLKISVVFQRMTWENYNNKMFKMRLGSRKVFDLWRYNQPPKLFSYLCKENITITLEDICVSFFFFFLKVYIFNVGKRIIIKESLLWWCKANFIGQRKNLCFFK